MGATAVRLGVAVSTHNRPDFLAASLAAWERYLPKDAVLAVVDDASDQPAVGATHRLPVNGGVAACKNAGLAALMDAGCDHMWLVDDDTRPKVPHWWQPYVNDPLPHLMLCWGRSRRLRADRRYTYWSHPRGVALYVQRHVVDKVGGMRTEFGRSGSEHVEWSRRIHHAGFTPHPYIDLHGATAWWDAEDWGKPGESIAQLGERRKRIGTVSKADRRASHAHRVAVMEKYEGVVEHVDYTSPQAFPVN